MNIPTLTNLIHSPKPKIIMKKLLLLSALIVVIGTAFGQTLQKGNLVGWHVMTINPDPDVTMNQFLEFWESKVIPEMKEAIPEMTSLLLKGIGVDN